MKSKSNKTQKKHMDRVHARIHLRALYKKKSVTFSSIILIIRRTRRVSCAYFSPPIRRSATIRIYLAWPRRRGARSRRPTRLARLRFRRRSGSGGFFLLRRAKVLLLLESRTTSRFLSLPSSLLRGRRGGKRNSLADEKCPRLVGTTPPRASGD